MKIKLFACTTLLLHTVFIVSMDRQLIARQDSIDPLKNRIALKLNGCSDMISTKVLESINKHTDENKTIVWNEIVKDLNHFEKSRTLSRINAAMTVGLNAINLGWLAVPTVSRMSSTEDVQVCFIKSMDPVVPAVEVINVFACVCSLYVLLQATGPHGGCSTSKKLSLNLRRFLKNKKTTGDVVKVQDLNPIIFNEAFRLTRQRKLFTQAAKFAELPDGTIDVAAFKKFLPRSYAMPDSLRYFMAFTFMANVFPSMLCAPGVWTNDSSGSMENYQVSLALLGLGLYLFNAVEAFLHVADFPITSNKEHADIRNVVNTIQDHLQRERSADDFV